MKESERLLAAGIRAARANQHDRARDLLMRVLEVDEENEEAWLWLSGSVEDIEDKRICLENVLTLNPDNEVAPLRLAELEDRSRAFARGEQAQMTKQPLGGALGSPYHPYAIAQNKLYDDVWATDQALCAFCATPVKRKQRRCRKCLRKTRVKIPVRETPSQFHEWLLIYLSLTSLLLIGYIFLADRVGLLADIRLLLGSGLQRQLMASAIFPLPFLILTLGIYFRRPWAYWVLALNIAAQLLGAVAFAATSLQLFLTTFLVLSPVYLLYGWLLYVLYRAWPDFERRPLLRIAYVPNTLTGPYELDKTAQILAKKGQWASAVLHWRRAVGNAGGNGFYQWRLAKAYAQLGFYRRAVDELQAAVTRLESEPREQAKAMRDLKRLQRKVKRPKSARPAGA